MKSLLPASLLFTVALITIPVSHARTATAAVAIDSTGRVDTFLTAPEARGGGRGGRGYRGGRGGRGGGSGSAILAGIGVLVFIGWLISRKK